MRYMAITRALVALAATIVLMVAIFLVHDYWTRPASTACDTIFEQTGIRLRSKVDIIKTAAGEVSIGRERLQGLTGDAQEVAVRLQSCCVMRLGGGLSEEGFLRCKEAGEGFENRVNQAVTKIREAQDAINAGVTELHQTSIRETTLALDASRAELQKLRDNSPETNPSPTRRSTNPAEEGREQKLGAVFQEGASRQPRTLAKEKPEALTPELNPQNAIRMAGNEDRVPSEKLQNSEGSLETVGEIPNDATTSKASDVEEGFNDDISNYRRVDTVGVPLLDAALNERQDERQLADNIKLVRHYVVRFAHLGWGFGPSVSALGLGTCFNHDNSPVSVHKTYTLAVTAFPRVKRCFLQRVNMPDNSWNKRSLDIKPPRTFEIFVPNMASIDMDTTGTWPFGRRLEDQVATRFLSLFLDMETGCGGQKCNADTLGDPARWAVAPIEPKTPPNPLANDKPFLKQYPYLAEPWDYNLQGR